MKFSDLPVDTQSIRIRPLWNEGSDVLRRARAAYVPVQRIIPTEVAAQFDLVIEQQLHTVEVLREADQLSLGQGLVTDSAFVARLGSPASDGSFELEVAFFVGDLLEFGTLEIGVDEYVIERAKSLNRAIRNDVHNWLRQQVTFEFDGKTYFCISVGSVVEELSRESNDGSIESPLPSPWSSEEEKKRITNPAAVVDVGSSFCMTGSDIRFVATQKSLEDGGEILIAKSLTNRTRKGYRSIRLSQGVVNLVDWTATGRLQARAKAQLSNLVNRSGSYLSRWESFGDIEGDLFLDSLRRFGAIRIGKFGEENAGKFSCFIPKEHEHAIHMLAEGSVDQLTVLDKEPDYVVDHEISFHDFKRSIVNDKRNDLRLFVFDFEKSTRKLILEGDGNPGPGYLVASGTGQSVQIKRRESARTRILEGSSSNPEIGLVIEESGLPRATRKPPKIKPLTSYVRDKVFSSPPTPNQERAIAVALNTPDIALIQGPPGTGKTTVIAAILERLNEIHTKSGGVGKGEVLLTGFQHDAVENMINRMSINGLPVPKFGLRSDRPNKSQDDFDIKLEYWCNQVATAIRERNPKISRIQSEVEIRRLLGQYICAPTPQLARILIDRILDVDISVVGESLAKRSREVAANLVEVREHDSPNEMHLKVARAIRSKSESFADDGPARAQDALIQIAPELDDVDKKLLKKVAQVNGPIDSDLLISLEDLKSRLISRFIRPPVFQVEKRNERLVALAKEIVQIIQSRGHGISDQKSLTLLAFLNDLEENPSLMRDSLASYSYAFASTVQQSASSEMHRRKTGNRSTEREVTGDNQIDYQYVIVDEAARVSPLDLMIPMSQGKRIILVGDHRQLPHIVEKEVERRFDDGEEGEDEAHWLKRSMFEYLFSERLKSLEEHDGVTRRVTLDQQFRMHPKLGEFVSRNFYERFDPLERFGSGLSEDKFAHSLPRTGGEPALWLDVTQGACRKDGKSYVRPSEAVAIADLLEEWLNSSESCEMTFGVISFYRSQADLIRRQLRDRGITSERVRVGTVDSFQGMEFDVVLLSAVRTGTRSFQGNTSDDSDKASGRRAFGHLCLYNRLNVSMSRQRKLLVVVGDPTLVEGELAAREIPALVDFRQIAETISVLKVSNEST